MRFQIEKEIFNYFKGMKVIAIVAQGIKLPEDPAAIEAMLNDAWQKAASAGARYENPQSHPFIKPWGDHMKAVGANRKQFPCSIESLVRRAMKVSKPININPLVDFYNAVSLNYLVPAGGFDIDALNNDLWLRFSKQGDVFLALDSNEEINLPDGEVSYADGSVIITRHFVWKQAKHAILAPECKNVLFVSEVLGELPSNTVDDVSKAFTDGLMQYFKVNTKAHVLDENNMDFFINH